MPAPDPPAATGLSLKLRLAALPRQRPRALAMRPDAAARAALARDLGLRALRKLEFVGTLTAEGRAGWRLTARLGASVVQDCRVSGAPVVTRIDEAVTRRYLPDLIEPAGPETEMPEDVDVEPLRPEIDLGEVMREALALALPPFPRAPGVSLPGAGPEPETSATPDRPNPFAVLAAIKRDDPGGREPGG